MSLHLNDLIPFKSYFIFKNQKKLGGKSKEKISEKVGLILRFLCDGECNDIFEDKIIIDKSYTYVDVFKTTRALSWLKTDYKTKERSIDYVLSVVLIYEGWTLISISDSKLSSSFFNFLAGNTHVEDDDFIELSKLIVLADGNQIQKFLTEESKINTFWLTGIHKPSVIKADSKRLAGLDLELVLDPHEDQSYQYTSAKFKQEDGTKLGISLPKSKVWLNRSKGLTDYIKSGHDLINHLNSAVKFKELDILATPVRNYDNLGTPIEMLLYYDPGLDNSEDGNEDKSGYEILNLEFKTLKNLRKDMWDKALQSAWLKKYYFRCEIFIENELIGTTNIQVGFKNNSKPLIKISTPNCLTGKYEKLLKKACRNSNLKIWFDSCHSLSEGRIFINIYNDVKFDFDKKGIFVKFDASTDITKEKPGSGQTYLPDSIGDTKSLFCWLKNNSFSKKDGIQFIHNKGILICDDGSGEIADFIYIYKDELTLFHIKGANNSSVTRDISVGAFEVVCSQAHKNIKFSSYIHLDKRLEDRKNKNRRIWQEGKLVDLEKVKKELNYANIENVNVVVFQPQLRKSKISKNDKRTHNQILLESLLCSLDRLCRGLEVNFYVIGEDDT